MYGGKFAFQSRFGQPYSWKEIYHFSLFCFVFEGNFQVQAPGGWREGACIWRDDLTEGFCVTSLGGFSLEGLSYFRNFTVFLHVNSKLGLQHPRVPLAATIGPFMNLL